MAELGEAFGKDYQQKSSSDKVAYAAKVIAANIANKEFVFRSDSQDIWVGNNMLPNAIQIMVDQVRSINSMYRLQYIDKRTEKVNMLPYLVNGAVEYFALIDLTDVKVKIYTLYVTPTNVEPF